MLTQRHIGVLIAFVCLFITSGTVLADDARVKVVDGKTYFNGTEAEARAYMATQIEATRAKAQAEADAKSKVWRERMDAAGRGHPDANFEADNKANYDLWAASHPAEVAQGIREQAAMAARGAQMAEEMKAESARNLEEFHQKMLAEGKLRGLDGQKMYEHAIGLTTEDPYKNEIKINCTDAEIAEIVANMRKQYESGMPANTMTVSENPQTSNGTPVGLSGFDSPPPKATVHPSSSSGPAIQQSAETVKTEVVKVPEPVKAKALVSLESKRDSEKE